MAQVWDLWSISVEIHDVSLPNTYPTTKKHAVQVNVMCQRAKDTLGRQN